MGREKRLRIAELERQRLERLARGEQPPARYDLKQQIFKCGKCKSFVVESAANAHLQKCQPHGAECGKCKKLIVSKDFISHFKSCEGVQHG